MNKNKDGLESSENTKKKETAKKNKIEKEKEQ